MICKITFRHIKAPKAITKAFNFKYLETTKLNNKRLLYIQNGVKYTSNQNLIYKRHIILSEVFLFKLIPSPEVLKQFRFLNINNDIHLYTIMIKPALGFI